MVVSKKAMCTEKICVDLFVAPPNVCRPQQVLILFESSSERMFLYPLS